MDGLWNVNIHYDARLAACVPAAAAAVLDVGCGDGFLAARLARRVPLVVAIDIDAPVLGRARARFPDAPVTWCHGDVLTHPLEPASFDAVLSNAALHHLPDARAALRPPEPAGAARRNTGHRRDSPAPGGATCRGPRPRSSRWVPPSGCAASGNIPRRRPGRPRTPSASSARRPARPFPAARIRRLLMGRYLLTWTRPRTGPSTT